MVVYSRVQQIFKSIFCVSLVIFTTFCLFSHVLFIQSNAYKITTPIEHGESVEEKEEAILQSSEKTSEIPSEHPTEKPDEIDLDELEIDDYLIFQAPKFCPPGQAMDEKGRCRKKAFRNIRKEAFS